MIAKAQVNVLPSFNNTGIKLKLLNALYSGRHCLVNTAGVDGSGLENICTVANDGPSFKKAVTELYDVSFNEAEVEKRKVLLAGLNNNKLNAEKIMRLYWPD